MARNAFNPQIAHDSSTREINNASAESTEKTVKQQCKLCFVLRTVRDDGSGSAAFGVIADANSNEEK
jgi:hypothetical protein